MPTVLGTYKGNTVKVIESFYPSEKCRKGTGRHLVNDGGRMIEIPARELTNITIRVNDGTRTDGIR